MLGTLLETRHKDPHSHGGYILSWGQTTNKYIRKISHCAKYYTDN